MIAKSSEKKHRVRRWKPAILLCLAMVFCSGIVAHAEPDAFPFNRGSARLSLLVGSGTAFDQDYTVLGIGGGYYVMDGLEVGLDAETWQGSSPHISRISPGLRYVLYTVRTIKPYVGVFYRRTFIEDYRDHNEAGFRAGGIVRAGRRVYFGAGIVYDLRLSCDKSVYSSCTDVYPEIMFAVLF